MFIIESYQYDKTGSTFMGYLMNFNGTGGYSFTRKKEEAYRFKTKDECVLSDHQSWENGRDGGRGYYRIEEIPDEKQHNIPGISNKVLNLILRKKTLWTEIKSLEQEYGRIGKQIRDIENDRKDISFRVQKKMQESQEIAEKLDEMEFEALKEEIEKEEKLSNPSLSSLTPDGTIKGKDLIFISWIKRDGSGTEDVSNKDMSSDDETIFTLNCLSISEKTYIANEFNSYVVKLKNPIL